MEALKQVSDKEALVRKLVVFSTENYNFATDIEYVSELLSDVTVHNTLTENKAVIGCISYRGQICTIVDFENLLKSNRGFDSITKKTKFAGAEKNKLETEVIDNGIKVLVFKTKVGSIGVKLDANARYLSLSRKDIFDSNTMIEADTSTFEGFFLSRSEER